MKLLLLAASLRQASLNKKLIRLVAKLLQEQKVEISLVEFNDFPITYI